MLYLTVQCCFFSDLYRCAKVSKWGDLLPTEQATAENTRKAKDDGEAKDELSQDDANNANTDVTADINVGI